MGGPEAPKITKDIVIQIWGVIAFLTFIGADILLIAYLEQSPGKNSKTIPIIGKYLLLFSVALILFRGLYSLLRHFLKWEKDKRHAYIRLSPFLLFYICFGGLSGAAAYLFYGKLFPIFFSFLNFGKTHGRFINYEKGTITYWWQNDPGDSLLHIIFTIAFLVVPLVVLWIFYLNAEDRFLKTRYFQKTSLKYSNYPELSKFIKTNGAWLTFLSMVAVVSSILYY